MYAGPAAPTIEHDDAWIHFVKELRSGAGDSNSDFFLGRKVGYHYTSPAGASYQTQTGPNCLEGSYAITDTKLAYIGLILRQLLHQPCSVRSPSHSLHHLYSRRSSSVRMATTITTASTIRSTISDIDPGRTRAIILSFWLGLVKSQFSCYSIRHLGG